MSQGRRLFDCFTFYDELDLLELRLEVTAPYVDEFVVVEAEKTFSGVVKPLHFELNKARFARWRTRSGTSSSATRRRRAATAGPPRSTSATR